MIDLMTVVNMVQYGKVLSLWHNMANMPMRAIRMFARPLPRLGLGSSSFSRLDKKWRGKISLAERVQSAHIARNGFLAALSHFHQRTRAQRKIAGLA